MSRDFAREIADLRAAFRAAHGREADRVVWSRDVAEECIEQVRIAEFAALYRDAHPCADRSVVKLQGVAFQTIDGPPNTLYVTDRDPDDPSESPRGTHG